MQNDLSRMLIVLLISLVGCQQLGYADLAAGEDAVPLVSDVEGIDSGAYYHYAVLQRISADRVVLVQARGYKKEIEEIKTVVHAVALTVRLPDGP